MNESNRRAGISPVSFGLFIVIVLFTLWVIGQNQMRKQEMTYPRFCQEVAAGNIEDVYIQQNEEVPTGTVVATMSDTGAPVRVYVSDVSAVQELLQKYELDYANSNVAENKWIREIVLPTALCLAAVMLLFFMMNRQGGGGHRRAGEEVQESVGIDGKRRRLWN